MTMYVSTDPEIESTLFRSTNRVLRTTRTSHIPSYHTLLASVSHISFTRVEGEDVDAIIRITGRY